MMKLPGRRRQLIINPDFQYRFLGYVLATALVTIVVFYAAKVFFFHEVGDYIRSMGLPDDHLVYQFLKKQSRFMDILFAGAGVIEMIFLGIAGLLMSNRVAGPLYRLVQHMNGITMGGPVKEVKFREGDYFQEVAEAYNRQLARTGEKILRMTAKEDSNGKRSETA
jgi:hypothetical protein